jgi:hypothetical protein
MLITVVCERRRRRRVLFGPNIEHNILMQCMGNNGNLVGARSFDNREQRGGGVEATIMIPRLHCKLIPLEWSGIHSQVVFTCETKRSRTAAGTAQRIRCHAQPL